MIYLGIFGVNIDFLTMRFRGGGGTRGSPIYPMVFGGNPRAPQAPYGSPLDCLRLHKVPMNLFVDFIGLHKSLKIPLFEVRQCRLAVLRLRVAGFSSQKSMVSLLLFNLGDLSLFNNGYRTCLSLWPVSQS